MTCPNAFARSVSGQLPNVLVRVLRFVGAADRGNGMSRLPVGERALALWLRVRCRQVDAETLEVGATFLSDLFRALPRHRASVRFAEARLHEAWDQVAACASDREVARRLESRREAVALLASHVASGMAVEAHEAREVLETQMGGRRRASLVADLERLAERHRLGPARPLTTRGRVSLPRVLRSSAPAHDGWVELAQTLEDAARNHGKALADLPPRPEHLSAAAVCSPAFCELVFGLRSSEDGDLLRCAMAELATPNPALSPSERRAFETLRRHLAVALGSGSLRRRGILYRLHLEAGLAASPVDLAERMGRTPGEVLLALDNGRGPVRGHSASRRPSTGRPIELAQ